MGSADTPGRASDAGPMSDECGLDAPDTRDWRDLVSDARDATAAAIRYNTNDLAQERGHRLDLIDEAIDLLQMAKERL